jgi:hypothetical protein
MDRSSLWSLNVSTGVFSRFLFVIPVALALRMRSPFDYSAFIPSSSVPLISRMHSVRCDITKSRLPALYLFSSA